MTPEEDKNVEKIMMAEGQVDSVSEEFMELVKEICDENDEALKELVNR